MDAYGALLYLAEQRFVDADRIAVVGYSQGAMVALSAVELNGIGTLFDRHFRAAIAYYPVCGDIAVVAPTGDPDRRTRRLDAGTRLSQRRDKAHW